MMCISTARTIIIVCKEVTTNVMSKNNPLAHMVISLFTDCAERVDNFSSLNLHSILSSYSISCTRIWCFFLLLCLRISLRCLHQTVRSVARARVYVPGIMLCVFVCVFVCVCVIASVSCYSRVLFD